jgi:C4-dicarboxylate-specific signal transduction histidine kinase
MVLRCEFSDQRVIRAADHARFDQTLIDRVHQLDRELIEMSGRVRAASNEDELSSALDEVARLLDERFGAIADAPSS